MTFIELKNTLISNGKILVTGPQRSGTTFSAYALSQTFKYPFVNEHDYGVHNHLNFINYVKNLTTFCAQGPGLCHAIEDIIKAIPDITIIVMRRNLEDIKKSEKRINWSWEQLELEKFGIKNKNKSQAAIKYDFIDSLSYDNIINLDYESMKEHPLWINKDKRKNFKSKQITIENEKIDLIENDEFKLKFLRKEIDGSEYILPEYAMHRPAVKVFLDNKLHEPDTHEFIKYICDNNEGSIVHAGTFFGDMLPNFSKFVTKNVYAFEPVLENFVSSKICIDANGLDNVILMSCALSEKIENLKIDTMLGGNKKGKHAGGKSSISKVGRICPTISLDSLKIDDLIILHLDVEGHELNAIKGSIKTIEKCKPIILIEDNMNKCKPFLSSLGYNLFGELPHLYVYVHENSENYKEQLRRIKS